MDKRRNRETGNSNEEVSIVVTCVAVLLRTVGRAVPVVTRVSFFLSLFTAAPVIAQETSLIDILKAKGVLSQEDVKKLRAGSDKSATGEDSQQALIRLLKAKGILNDQDLAKLQSPEAETTDVSARLSRIEDATKQLMFRRDSRA